MAATNNRSLLIDVLIILALGGIALAGYWFSPLILPKADLTLMPVEGCDLNRTACSAAVPGGGTIVLDIAPRPIPVVKPLAVNATLRGIEADKVELDFQGVAMEMGYNRVTLTPTGEGHYTATPSIPVCVTGRMVWRATLMVETGSRRIAVPYIFEAPLAE